MKELLGWYGYGSHESADIVSSNTSNLTAIAMPHDLTSSISNDIGTNVTMLMNKRHGNTPLTDQMNSNSKMIMEKGDLTNAAQNKSAIGADKQGSYSFVVVVVVVDGCYSLMLWHVKSTR